MKIYGYIYKIVCKINGKIYIGQTTRTLASRLNGHFYDSVKTHRNPTKIGMAILKYGRKNFIIYPICKAYSKKELDSREAFCIKIFNSINNGYNIQRGGRTYGPWTQEQKDKMSKSRKGKPKPKGFGQKISSALKGKKKSKSHRLNNRLSQINCRAHHDFRHSEESKKKIGNAHRGKIVSEETRNKIIKANTGRIASEETKNKMRERRIGRKPALGMAHTEESKKKISDGVKNSSKKGKRNLIYCDNNGKTYLGYRSAAEDLGIKNRIIVDFFSGKTKTAKGFIFKKIG